MTEPADQGVQDNLDREFRRQVEWLASHLDATAGRIRDIARRGVIDRRTLTARHNAHAADVIHELFTSLGNSNTWTLQRAADDAQRWHDQHRPDVGETA